MPTPQKPTPKKPTGKTPSARSTASRSSSAGRSSSANRTAASRPSANRSTASARTSAATAAKRPAAKKKKKGHGRAVLSVLMVVLILAASGFIYYLGRTMYAYYKEQTTDTGSDTDLVSPITYETTPVAQSSKVGYYLVGLMGADGNQGKTEMLSLACFDKKAKSVNILQVPQDTYLGTDGTFKVKRISEIFANPQDVDWCENCRRRVYAPEKGEDNTHTVCGKTLTKKEGSATVNLAEAFNLQYGMPVDGYYILEQDSLVKLVDLVGGIDIDLAFDVKVDDTTYTKGVHTIDGAAALSYVMASDDKIESDIDRFSRFQQVFTALLQRLFRMSETELTDDVFKPLMRGSTPLRVAVGDDYESIVKLVHQLSGVSFENMTAYVLPGESAKSDGSTYYSVHRQELLALLNDRFNPYGDPLTEGDLGAAELKATGSADLHETKLSQWMQEQTGATTTSEDTTSTTAAA